MLGHRSGAEGTVSSCSDSDLQIFPAKHLLIAEKNACLDSYSLEAGIKDLPQQIKKTYCFTLEFYG